MAILIAWILSNPVFAEDIAEIKEIINNIKEVLQCIKKYMQ